MGRCSCSAEVFPFIRCPVFTLLNRLLLSACWPSGSSTLQALCPQRYETNKGQELKTLVGQGSLYATPSDFLFSANPILILAPLLRSLPLPFRLTTPIEHSDFARAVRVCLPHPRRLSVIASSAKNTPAQSDPAPGTTHHNGPRGVCAPY